MLAGGGSPVDKLLSTLGNRDTDEISEQHPPVRALMLTDDMECVFVGREGDLLVAVLVYGRKAIRQPEHDCGGAVGEFKQIVSDHVVNVTSFAFGRRFL